MSRKRKHKARTPKGAKAVGTDVAGGDDGVVVGGEVVESMGEGEVVATGADAAVGTTGEGDVVDATGMGDLEAVGVTEIDGDASDVDAVDATDVDAASAADVVDATGSDLAAAATETDGLASDVAAVDPSDVDASDVDAAGIDAPDLSVANDAAVGEGVVAELPTTASAMGATQLKYLIEALIFASDKPVTLARLRQLTRVSEMRRIEQALEGLAEDYKDRGLVLQQVSGGYQFRTRTQWALWVQQLIAGRPVRLSRAQLETLAIIAYRQPITRPEIDDIRGVDSSQTLKLLLDRALIRMLGKKEEVGRPILYGTTKEFLDFFSLGDLRELPTLREYSELTDESRRRMGELGVEPPEVDGAEPSGDAIVTDTDAGELRAERVHVAVDPVDAEGVHVDVDVEGAHVAVDGAHVDVDVEGAHVAVDGAHVDVEVEGTHVAVDGAHVEVNGERVGVDVDGVHVAADGARVAVDGAHVEVDGAHVGVDVGGVLVAADATHVVVDAAHVEVDVERGDVAVDDEVGVAPGTVDYSDGEGFAVASVDAEEGFTAGSLDLDAVAHDLEATEAGTLADSAGADAAAIGEDGETGDGPRDPSSEA